MSKRVLLLTIQITGFHKLLQWSEVTNSKGNYFLLCEIKVIVDNELSFIFRNVILPFKSTHLSMYTFT